MLPAWLRAKLFHYSQVAKRLITLTILGIILILSSHFLAGVDEREWLRDAGSSMIAYAFARWLSEQGKRRLRDDGSPVRQPTMKIKTEDVNRIDSYLKGKKR